MAATFFGCHHIPTTRPSRAAGMGEASISDEEIRSQWARAAAGPNAKSGHGSKSASSSTMSDRRFAQVKRFFSDTSEPEHSSVPSESPSEPRAPLGKTVPLAATPKSASPQKSALPQPADVVADAAEGLKKSGKVGQTAQAAVSLAKSLDVTDDIGALVSHVERRVLETKKGVENVSAALFVDSANQIDAILPVGYTDLESVETLLPVNLTPHGLAVDELAMNELADTTLSILDSASESGEMLLTSTLQSSALSMANAAFVADARNCIATSPLAFLLDPNAPTEAQPVSYDAPSFLGLEIPTLPSATDLSLATDDWRTAADHAAALLKREIDRQAAEGRLAPAAEARLRLLMLSTGNIPGAVEKIASTTPELADFWVQQCHGLGTLLASQEEAAADSASIRAATGDLSAGLERLRQRCPATILKMHNVEEAAAFGLFRKRTAPYHPGDTGLIYLELDNIHCRPNPDGYEIGVACRWELFDGTGRSVATGPEQICASQSASPLKDIVLNLSVRFPHKLVAGDYRLEIVLRDMNSSTDEPAQSSLTLSVR